MANIKYAGEEAVGRIADYVNNKLTFVSSMPQSPETNTIVLYVGSTTASYVQGGIYKYDGTNWNRINSGGSSGGGVDPAPEFSTSTDYGVGDYVVYENETYRCTTAHSAGAWNSSDFTKVYIAGQYVTAGKKEGTILGECATAEGYNTTASNAYSHAEGFNTIASGFYSHAEGSSTKASDYYSHAEGFQTKAIEECSHAEGRGTTASGECSHAEGKDTEASGNYSHAEGNHTQTGADYQHVQGKFNVGKSTTLFEIGNGTDDNARSNALEIDTNGNVIASGIISGKGFSIPINPQDTTGMNIWIVDN